jgi:voltage-gated potassium channel
MTRERGPTSVPAVAFSPGGKVRHPCPRCGLQRHEADAVHCKACGMVLNIPDDED